MWTNTKANKNKMAHGCTTPTFLDIFVIVPNKLQFKTILFTRNRLDKYLGTYI